MFLKSISDTSQSKDLPKGAVVAGVGHTHGEENSVNLVMRNGGDRLLSEKAAAGELSLKDFGKGSNQYKIFNGDNAPSYGDLQTSSFPNISSESFEKSFIFTPSGLVYSSG